MELLGDSDPEDNQIDLTQESSEHFLKRHKKKHYKNTDYLKIGETLDDGNVSDASAGSEHDAIIDSSGKTVKEKTFRRKLNPRYDLYLQKAEVRPKRLKKTKFLSDNYFEHVALACYQRSGSTLLRKYIENITGVFTGSDGDVHSKLDKQLQDLGLAGESILGKDLDHIDFFS